MQEVLVNRLGDLSLPRKSVVRLTDRPDMTLDVYRGRKITMQQLFKIHCSFQMLSFYHDLPQDVVGTVFLQFGMHTIIVQHLLPL